MSGIEWRKAGDGVCHIAEIGNVRLSVAPDRTITRNGVTKGAQGTKWRAFCWKIDGKGSSRRIGRDIYEDSFSSPGEAMNHAEAVYNSL